MNSALFVADVQKTPSYNVTKPQITWFYVLDAFVHLRRYRNNFLPITRRSRRVSSAFRHVAISQLGHYALVLPEFRCARLDHPTSCSSKWEARVSDKTPVRFECTVMSECPAGCVHFVCIGSREVKILGCRRLWG